MDYIKCMKDVLDSISMIKIIVKSDIDFFNTKVFHNSTMKDLIPTKYITICSLNDLPY